MEKKTCYSSKNKNLKTEPQRLKFESGSLNHGLQFDQFQLPDDLKEVHLIPSYVQIISLRTKTSNNSEIY